MTEPGLLPEAVGAAEELLRDVYRLDVAKALNPLDARDFLVLVQRLGRALRGVSRDAEADALRRAIGTLNVDWPNLGAAARDQVIRAARQAMNGAAAQVLPRVDHLLEVEGERVVAGTRRAAARRFGLHIAADTTRTDERIAHFVRRSEGHFIRDQYGQRADELGQRARDIVAAGLERGLGRDDIVSDLSAALTVVTGRSKAYWEVVATNFANRGRTYTQLAAFQEADIQRFRFDAVLDQVTSLACRFMHGRVFSVARAMRRFDDVEQADDPEAIVDLQPWVQVGADDDGNQVLFYKRAGRRRVVAQVDESAVGASDKVGRFSRAMSTYQLETAGVCVPPVHGRCRSSIVIEEG
jgi:SPP1 gp7 family putative phage head morphogenesis protein